MLVVACYYYPLNPILSHTLVQQVAFIPVTAYGLATLLPFIVKETGTEL